MNRHQMREHAMIAIYQYLIQGEAPLNCLSVQLNRNVDELEPYFHQTLQYFYSNRDEFALLIESNLVNWELERLSKVEQAILLLGITEIKSQIVEKPIVINEAITLAKAYCDEDSYKFINATLDKC
jgi:transcription antitermination protein NusB